VQPAIAQTSTRKHVLVLYESNRLLPANIERDRGLNEVIASSGEAVDVRAEFLDYPEFGGEEYVRTIVTYLREKYRHREPDIIVAARNGALEFVIQNRSKLFPRAPIVHMAIDKDFLLRLELPPDAYGVPVADDVVGTVAQALKWHPGVTRLVTVTGVAPDDQVWLARIRRELAAFQGQFARIDYLSGLSTTDVRKRVSQLGKDALVFTPGYFTDGAGQNFAPRQAAVEIAAAASVPVYGPYNTFIGTGVVGGRVPPRTSIVSSWLMLHDWLSRAN
jgi:hypothetical protein